MEVVNIKIDSIIPYEKNSRRNDEGVKFVKNSIKEFGFKQPIIIDKDNVIVCGHTRHRAAVELKLSEVSCIYADDLTDEQIMGGRGASLGVSVKGKKYGSEYRTILKHGYNHNKNDGKKGASKLSLKEEKMVEKVNKIWYNYINKNR
ncbi:ParB N-terminal domain-containing protein [Peptoniphilus asaccharolyticus]